MGVDPQVNIYRDVSIQIFLESRNENVWLGPKFLVGDIVYG